MKLLKVVLASVLFLPSLACARDDGTRRDPVPTTSESPASSPTGGGRDDFELSRVKIDLQEVASGLQTPILVTNAGDDRLFVAEQNGRILILHDGEILAWPFLDISSLTTAGGEQGLLGLAFHPDYQDNGNFFVNYTDHNGDTHIVRYTVTRDPNVADPGSAHELVRIDQPYSNHNGGGLAFGPDGHLYAGMGDGGSGGDPENRAQDLSTLLGKMLRFDVGTSGEENRAPGDNPFRDREGAQPLIWLYGLRNPWRFSFDRATGDLWIGDVGQGLVEEIDVVAAEDGGLNLGWRIMEGDRCFEPSCDRDGLTLPVAVYEHAGEHCSVTGGFVYRGRDVASLIGGYLFGDYCSGVMWVLDARVPTAGSRRVLESGIMISSFGENAAGELFVTDHAGGRVLKVVAG